LKLTGALNRSISYKLNVQIDTLPTKWLAGKSLMGKLPEMPAIKIRDCLVNFSLTIHDERTLPNNWLVDGLAAEQKRYHILLSCER
jgi:hypothetical protein